MKFFFRSLVLAVAFLANPSSAGVSKVLDFVQPDIDIAGVSLGMVADDAFAALEAKGYKPRDYKMERGPSFGDLLAIASGELEEDAAQSDWTSAFFHKGKEEIFLEFKPLPTGNGVAEIVYRNNASVLDFDTFITLATQKYGKPSALEEREAFWSDLPMNSDNRPDVENEGISLELNGHGKIKMVLNGGKIGLFDAASEAKDWAPVPETTF